MTRASQSATSASIQSVAVAFDILEELARVGSPIGVSDLARRLGQTKARVFRHLNNLRELGFVSKDETTDRYQLGWKIYRLGMSVAENFGLRRVAHRYLRRLSEETQQTALLTMPANTDVIVIDAVQSSQHIAITVRPGAVIPAATSALGRAILAFASDDMVELTLSRPLDQLTEHTLTNVEEIQARLQLIREHWYEVAVAERLLGIAALAAPVFDHQNRVCGSIAIVASQSVIDATPDPLLIAQVQSAARDISRELRSTAWKDVRIPAIP